MSGRGGGRRGGVPVWSAGALGRLQSWPRGQFWSPVRRAIGGSIATRLADRGWTVIVGVRNRQDAAEVVAHNPERTSSIILDVTEAKHVRALDPSLNERLDAIVNNAGVVVAGPLEAVPRKDSAANSMSM